MSCRSALIQTIKESRLHFRSQEWHERLFMAEEGMYDESFCEILLTEARFDAEAVLEQGNLLWRVPTIEELKPPEITLGYLIESEQKLLCGINILDRPRNVLIVGGAGSGKTSCARNICFKTDLLNQSHPNDPTLLCIIDIKPDYTDLADELTGESENLCCINNPMFGLNGPANVAPYIWIGHISLSLAARLNLIASRTCLTSIIASLLLILNKGLKEDDLNDPSVSKDLIWPPLEMVLKATKQKDIMAFHSSKAAYSQSLIQALEGLLQDSGKLFDCCNGFDINDNIEQKKHTILNVSILPTCVQHVITDLLINQTLVKRMAENYKTDHADIIYLLDECELLLESDVSNFPGLSPLDKLHRLGREMGLMSIVTISGM